MEIHLKPELEAEIERNVTSGRYASAEDFLTAAIEFHHEREQWRVEAHESEIAELDASVAEAERGELIDEEEIRRRLRAMKMEGALRQSA